MEYEFNEKSDFYITLTLLDIKRGGIVVDTERDFMMTNRGMSTAYFTLPLSAFNDGEYRIQAQIRTIDSSQKPARIEKIAYTSDENSCIFVIRDENNTNNYGLLSKRVVAFSRVDEG